MYRADPYDRLPDPEFQAEFYRDVPMKRAFAWVVDTILIVLLTAIVVPFTAFIALFFLPALFLVLNFLYRWVTISTRSATWGMRLAAIEFRRLDGAPFDPMTAFLHTLGYTISCAMVLPQLASIGAMLVTARGQGLSDLILGTVAINRPGRV
ncbi:RDD family protein [Solirhodobacter olei]|uniref:RDD family protein n=1 Tax=Solirhodobacter olei TaxID=2493082 RepID=UPI000FDBD8D8|nr:RDD family protein [Solirhodobacter olei]